MQISLSAYLDSFFQSSLYFKHIFVLWTWVQILFLEWKNKSANRYHNLYHFITLKMVEITVLAFQNFCESNMYEYTKDGIWYNYGIFFLFQITAFFFTFERNCVIGIYLRVDVDSRREGLILGQLSKTSTISFVSRQIPSRSEHGFNQRLLHVDSALWRLGTSSRTTCQHVQSLLQDLRLHESLLQSQVVLQHPHLGGSRTQKRCSKLSQVN